MDKRTAKREACFRAALGLESLLNSDWPTGLAERYGEADAEKVIEGMNELMRELATRGGREPW
ncbi:hypothetical protein ACQEVF_59455 [Nonomuraea polychroma]|uniref:hypothetical protein n=1 Tax=Nonomuraea polychroma TaxID=46176 RepID=UPI003D90A6C8